MKFVIICRYYSKLPEIEKNCPIGHEKNRKKRVDHHTEDWLV